MRFYDFMRLLTYFLLLRNYDKVFCKAVKNFASIFCNDDKVFDTYADSLVCKVDARLYGEYHARLQGKF